MPEALIKINGGANQIGGTNYEIRYQGKVTLIDFGILFKRHSQYGIQISSLPAHPPEHADAIFISHSHSDHYGGIPAANKLYPNAKIWCTRPTYFQGQVLFADALNIFDRSEKQYGIKLLYSRQDLIATNERTEIIDEIKWYQPYEDSDLRILPWPSGHIPGAASFFIQAGKKLMFISGDICFWDQPTVLGASPPPPELVGRVDLALFEATNGLKEFPDRAREDAKIVEEARKVLERGGFVLNPAYSTRSADVVKNYIDGGIVPKIAGGKITGSIVVADGMAARMLEVYCNEKRGYWANDVDRSNIRIFNPEEFSKTGELNEVNVLLGNYQIRNWILNTPNIIVATSGTMEFGVSRLYAPIIAEDPKSAFFFTGHLFEGTPSEKIWQNYFEEGHDLTMYELLETGMPIDFGGGETVMFRADVKRFEVTSHADPRHTVHYLGEVLRPRRVCFVHGHTESQMALMDRLKRFSTVSAFQSTNGMEMEL